MAERFSYSKLDTFSQCGFRYKLRYVDKHFVDTGGLATELGTAVHETEETIANRIKAGEPINYIELKNKLILKMMELKHKYGPDFEARDKSDRTTADKIFGYLESGIYRLENFLMANSHIKVSATEQEFNFTIQDVTFHGFIDRVLFDTKHNSYIIQDIKTYAQPLEKKKLETPLQFVIYVLALMEMFNLDEEQIACSYDLPFCEKVQEAGTKGYLERGKEELQKLLDDIHAGKFEPNPTPLCHWCEFCPTNPNQVEAAKNLCPYHSKWTKENRTFEVGAKWEGLENHEQVLFEYVQCQNSAPNAV